MPTTFGGWAGETGQAASFHRRVDDGEPAYGVFDGTVRELLQQNAVCRTAGCSTAAAASWRSRSARPACVLIWSRRMTLSSLAASAR